MTSFATQRFSFIGSDKIRKGADWIKEYQFLDSEDAPINMADYDPSVGGSARMAVKSGDLATTYFSTAAGTIGLTWTDVSTLRLTVVAAASAALSGTIPNTAIFQVEAVSGTTGQTDRLLEGRIEMDFEVVTAAS